jgi:hypothetical protein
MIGTPWFPCASSVRRAIEVLPRIHDRFHRFERFSEGRVPRSINGLAATAALPV